MSYTLSDFDYDLPKNRIAQKPASPRDHARLLIYNRETKSITDDYFYNLTDYLPPQTILVTNNSKVEKCRLLFDEGKKEVFILGRKEKNIIRALVRPGKKFRKGKTVTLSDNIEATVLDIDTEGIRTLKMNLSLDDEHYNRFKHTPFPPYIEQNESLSDEYQTIYAKNGGSKAAPTAGLHFTRRLLDQISEAGIERLEVTLHVGLGTFAPVKTEEIENHNMHSEWYQITEAAADKLNNSKHITAVGSTSLRVLEACRQHHSAFQPEKCETDIFIRPGYKYRAVDALITNFHLPKSTLLMLVAAFIGFDEMHRVYRYAINNEYRFYSFGDGMLIV
ncbi:MAG TPA: tRNA preQ1(34) S-adenosylmethionine ribosyltransferase-isomerase QueA [Balneolaceae bacterium]|nr:tRNA preQ1(34) S-adenosylmethionine ribosyltransferase-isomerase QueA [Balneolaceae bacterium]